MSQHTRESVTVHALQIFIVSVNGVWPHTNRVAVTSHNQQGTVTNPRSHRKLPLNNESVGLGGGIFKIFKRQPAPI